MPGGHLPPASGTFSMSQQHHRIMKRNMRHLFRVPLAIFGLMLSNHVIEHHTLRTGMADCGLKNCMDC